MKKNIAWLRFRGMRGTAKAILSNCLDCEYLEMFQVSWSLEGEWIGMICFIGGCEKLDRALKEEYKP
jgi:hypothetical protein